MCCVDLVRMSTRRDRLTLFPHLAQAPMSCKQSKSSLWFFVHLVELASSPLMFPFVVSGCLVASIICPGMIAESLKNAEDHEKYTVSVACLCMAACKHGQQSLVNEYRYCLTSHGTFLSGMAFHSAFLHIKREFRDY